MEDLQKQNAPSEKIFRPIILAHALKANYLDVIILEKSYATTTIYLFNAVISIYVVYKCIGNKQFQIFFNPKQTGVFLGPSWGGISEDLVLNMIIVGYPPRSFLTQSPLDKFLKVFFISTPVLYTVGQQATFWNMNSSI